jgi:hypothetical protein
MCEQLLHHMHWYQLSRQQTCLHPTNQGGALLLTQKNSEWHSEKAVYCRPPPNSRAKYVLQPWTVEQQHLHLTWTVPP